MKKLKNPVSTISGILILAVSIISAFNVINGDQAVTLTALIPEAVGAIVGILGVFGVKDGSKNVSDNV